MGGNGPRDDDAERLERHLLGGLSEEESAALEERLLAENELFELAEAVEADLVAAHARGELRGAAAEAAARLAATPRGRRAAAMDRDLARLAGESPAVLPFRPRAAAAPLRPALRLALAACLAAAVGVAGWLWVERQALREDGAAVEALRRPPRGSRGPIMERARPEEPEEIAEQRTSPRAGERGERARRVDPGRPPGAVEATLLLSLATLRSEGEAPRLALPAGTERVRLEVDLGEAGAGYASYRATLQNAAGGTVWNGQDIAVAPGGTLRLEVPAAALAPGRHVLTVAGVTAEGAVEELGYPEFEVD